MTRSELIQKLLGEVSMIKLSLRANDPLVPIIEPHRYEEYDFLESLLLAEQKRDKGCDMCLFDDGTKVTHLVLAETCEGDANYCPRCGRDLTEGESV